MEISPVILISLAEKSKFLVGFGQKELWIKEEQADLEEINHFITRNQGKYIFSALSYDLKNEVEELSSKNPDRFNFPLACFWTAEVVVELSEGKYEVLEGNLSEVHEAELQRIFQKFLSPDKLPAIRFQTNISKDIYKEKVKAIQHEIQIGNVYELNFCQEFYAENVPTFDSYSLFKQLFQLTKAPFSCYLKLNEIELFCGSPERFIKKQKNELLSQPIKGTIRRGKNGLEDQQLKKSLQNDPKERAENIMITDLVRNDLSRIALRDSVNVDELCGLYTFGTVHQLISTISCKLKPDTTFTDIVKATFPMGSMTGAPKISAMQLIDQFESFRRGIYSGSVGYMNPQGDVDFNVVIRSLIYNREKKYLSCPVGGAITIQSDPEKEYEECLTKVQRLIGLFA